MNDRPLKGRELNALILAGNSRAYVPVGKRNKALIRIKGRRLIEYVAEALDASPLISSITVIGIPQRLAFLKEELDLKTPLEIIPQKENIIRNVLHGYDHILPEHNAPILVATADIPLLTASEITWFIENSGYEDYDYVMGFTTERALEPFYPHGNKRGMRMSYQYFKQTPARINNLHIINPSVVKHPEYGGILYSLRYQKRIGNFLRIVKELFGKDLPTFELLKWAFMLEMAVQFDRFGWYGKAHQMGSKIDVHVLEELISRTLNVRFKTCFLDFGGAALDIDNRRDKVTISRRFDEWRELIKEGEREFLLKEEAKNSN
jgi:GTP:adenosylcobinamide-phosphate guanylyltransferase